MFSFFNISRQRKQLVSLCLFVFITGSAIAESDQFLMEPTLPLLFKETKSKMQYEVFYHFQKEQWDDAKIQSTPRIQFYWHSREDAGNDSIWSMRLDGSDLREVVSAKLLDTPKEGSLKYDSPIVRSPDNRYIAFTATTCYECAERRIIDLETKEVIIADVARYRAHFQWMPDSKSVLFLADGLVHYDLISRKGVNITNRFKTEGYWNYWALLDNGKKLIASIAKSGESNGYIFDFKTGKQIKKIKGWYISARHGDRASVDKKYIITGNEGKLRGDVWAEFTTPKLPFERISGNLGNNYHSMTYGAPIYRSFSKGISVVHPEWEKRKSYILRGPNGEGSETGGLSLYNVTPKDLDVYYGKHANTEDVVAEKLKDFTVRNAVLSDEEREDRYKAAQEYNEWLMEFK